MLQESSAGDFSQTAPRQNAHYRRLMARPRPLLEKPMSSGKGAFCSPVVYLRVNGAVKPCLLLENQ